MKASERIFLQDPSKLPLSTSKLGYVGVQSAIQASSVFPLLWRGYVLRVFYNNEVPFLWIILFRYQKS